MSSSKLQQIDPNKVPNHIAIIMDGNGRWARERGEARSFGHENGVETVRTVLRAANKLGVKVLTLYTFSEENWKRPIEEVEALMELLVSAVTNELDELNANGVKLQMIGNIEDMPEKPRAALREAIEKTSDNQESELVLAINYSGRTELIRAANRLIRRGEKHIDEEKFRKELYLGALPDPDLLIRTGGELRVSNFLLWQMAYTELYFTDVYWPDFGEDDLYDAILDFQERERRFGKTGEQIFDSGENNSDDKR